MIPVRKMFSVVIPLYNKENYIRDTIYSVLNQTYNEFEIIVVNDGSTDKSLEVVRSIKDNRIRIIDKSNGGESSARNAGIISAKNPYVALLDADDIWESTFLYEMNELINKYPDASLYGSSYTFIFGSGKKAGVTNSLLPDNFEGYISDYFKIAVNNPLYSSSCTVLIKTCIDKVGLFDETLYRGEDIDMWIRFALTEKLAYTNKSLAFYKLDAENSVMKNKCDKQHCLIWNLSKYKTHEQSFPEFKYFLDKLRLAHINNYLNGNRSEVDEIDTLLNDIDLNKFPFIWKIIKTIPGNFRIPIFKVFIFMKRALKFTFNRIIHVKKLCSQLS